MAKLKIKIIDEIGIHARPGTILVGEAGKYKSDISITSDGKSGNLKSILNLLSMGLVCNSEATIIFKGDDEKEALAGFKNLFFGKDADLKEIKADENNLKIQILEEID